jgi:hypothetical protein
MIKRILFSLMLCLSFTASGSAYANPELEQALLGRWYSENTDTMDPEGDLIAGSVKVSGVDEYLGNNGTNSQGQVLMTFKYKNGTTVEASWLVTAASEWQIKNGSLFEKVVDVRAIPEYVKTNGETLSDADQKEFFTQANFKIEDLIPKGQTSEDIIISIDATKFVSKSKNDDGAMIENTKTRTDKNFSAYKK